MNPPEPTPDPRLEYLRGIPLRVCLNWLEDITSDTIGMSASTFALGMTPLFKQTQPMELFDLCVARLREKAEKNVALNERNK
jgi:hypothetical protein